MKYAFLFFGAIFGFLVSRAGATTFDFYAKLFLFQDLQLLWVIATAVIVGMAGVAALKAAGARALLTGDALVYEAKPMRKGVSAGALIFGVGWGLAGACPGTAPAMLGEGKLAAGFTVVGILLGTYVYGLLQGSARSARGGGCFSREGLNKSLPGLFRHAKRKAWFSLCSIFQTLACLKNARPSVAGREPLT